MKIEFENKPVSITETWKGKLKIQLEDEIHDYDFYVIVIDGIPNVVWISETPAYNVEMEQYVIDKFLER